MIGVCILRSIDQYTYYPFDSKLFNKRNGSQSRKGVNSKYGLYNPVADGFGNRLCSGVNMEFGVDVPVLSFVALIYFG